MQANECRRIAITGIGLCTPLGANRESTWQGLLSGHSATRWLIAPHWTDETRMAGAPVCLPEPRSYQPSEPLVELALTTAAESLADARLDSSDLKSKNVGVVFGTSKGGLHSFSRMLAAGKSLRGRSEHQNSNEWLDVFPDRAAVAIRQMIGGFGPVLCPVMACATGLAACLRGAELIASGECDIVLAGSADVSLQPALLGSFRRLGVLSREANDPSQACRPYDLHRSGFLIGEGAACLVMERLESANRRKANCYAEWLGGRMLSDSHSLTQLDPTGASLRRLLQDLYSICSRFPDYLNLHGTGTATNDLIECQSIRAVCGEESSRIHCSSLKGGLGHLLGAAGSVELAATALSLRDQMIPPTVNLNQQDPACHLNLTPQVKLDRRIDHAWKLSMGFGGHIAGACLGRLR
jgi:3-oxoacyl-[acyl-carrier-protein] synthase II